MNNESMIYDYPFRHLWRDYLRSLVGLAVCLPPLLGLNLLPWVAWVFGFFVTCFTIFLFRTLNLQWMRIRVNHDRLVVSGLVHREVSLNDMTKVKLQYFTTRSSLRRRFRLQNNPTYTEDKPKPHQEWYQLALGFKKRSLRIDSNIRSFDKLLDELVPWIQSCQPLMNQTTIDNFFELGYDVTRHNMVSAS